MDHLTYKQPLPDNQPRLVQRPSGTVDGPHFQIRFQIAPISRHGEGVIFKVAVKGRGVGMWQQTLGSAEGFHL